MTNNSNKRNTKHLLKTENINTKATTNLIKMVKDEKNK